MPSIDSALNTGAHQRRMQYVRWARLLDTILPPPEENRLVPVAEAGRGTLPMVEDGLTEDVVAGF